MSIYKGTMLSEAPFPNLAVLFQKAGLDFWIIDTEHGGFDFATLSALIMNARLCGLRTIIRLPDNGRRDITRMMDMGADGLLLPMTNCAADIGRVVEFAKYAPTGKRGISTTRAHTLYSPPPLAEYMRAANERTMVFAQIETAAGLRAVEEILASDGVSGAFVGPNDLSCDLNCIGNEEPILQAIDRVAQAAQRAGREAGVITGTEAYLRRAAAGGMRYLCVGSELHMLLEGARRVVRQICTMEA